MTDREALLRAVALAPGDAAPRLILADYIEEHGDDAAWLRCPGTLWAMRDQTRLLVSSVLYWQVGTGGFVRLGLVLGWRPSLDDDRPAPQRIAQTRAAFWNGPPLSMGWVHVWSGHCEWPRVMCLCKAEHAHIRRLTKREPATT